MKLGLATVTIALSFGPLSLAAIAIVGFVTCRGWIGPLPDLEEGCNEAAWWSFWAVLAWIGLAFLSYLLLRDRWRKRVPDDPA